MKGFVFGKFLPFHRGHEYMMRFARQQCQQLTVLVCCSNKETIPGGVRKAWIEETLSDTPGIDVQVYEYDEDELPNSSVSSQEVSKVWAAVFKELLPEHGLLVTSEPYGKMVAAYMGITHIPFDIAKTMVPVSATLIRSNIAQWWDYLPASVKPSFSTKVVLLGSESTGKTTLTQWLAWHYGCGKVAEAGRDIIEDSREFYFEDLQLIAREHAARIKRAVAGPNPMVIIDTDIHITMSYARFAFGRELHVSDDIYEANKAHLYLYLNTDLPYYQDGTRLEEHDRNRLDLSHRQMLAQCGIKFAEITGEDLDEDRFLQAIDHIDAFLKERKHITCRL